METSTIISSKVERSGASRPLVAAIGGRNPQTVLRPPCSNGQPDKNLAANQRTSYFGRKTLRPSALHRVLEQARSADLQNCNVKLYSGRQLRTGVDARPTELPPFRQED